MGFLKTFTRYVSFCWTEFYEEESLRAIVLGLVLSVLCFFSSARMKTSFVASTFFWGAVSLLKAV